MQPKETQVPDQFVSGKGSAYEAAVLAILRAINRSDADYDPIFSTILEYATKLCNAPFANLNLVNEDQVHLDFVAHWGSPLKSFQPGWQWLLDSPMVIARAVREKHIIHIHDMADDDVYRRRDPLRVKVVEDEGIRTFLAVPLISGNEAIGSIGLFRREVAPFSSAQIEIIETFAEQAVIAIEKVRQFRELHTRFEREAATREILHVISRSRDDEAPVFKVILDNAARLCDAPNAYLHLCNEKRTHLHVVAHAGTRHAFLDFLAENPLPLDKSISQSARAVLDKAVLHEEDLADHELYRMGERYRVRSVDVEGIRTFLCVPLISGDEAIGNISLYRREVRPFNDRQVELVQTFAAQAVIAVENARQFRAIHTANSELQFRLERETATRHVLDVISRSRDDEQPVFGVVLENAARLCEAPMALLFLVNPERTQLNLEAYRGSRQEFARRMKELPVPLDATEARSAQAVLEKRVIRSDDNTSGQLYENRQPNRVLAVEEEGIRSAIYVPLVRDDKGIGCIVVYRREVKPFSRDHVALVEGFAAQAVIAIENVRQFRALESLNAELGDRVEDQVGEIERMGKLKRFLPSAVADTVLSQGSDKMLSSHRALLGVLFCDIRGFTAFCETAEPEETIEVLQAYHEEMGKLIDAHGAGVDHRMGDGIMVLFNDPLPCEDPAGDAVRLALAMRTRMADLCKSWRRLGHRLGFGVGISLGYATVGMVGYEGRYDYTASGTSVNLAARLCDQAEDGEILLSPRTYAAIEDDFKAASNGEVRLKGIREPVEVFRLTDPAEGSAQQ